MCCPPQQKHREGYHGDSAQRYTDPLRSPILPGTRPGRSWTRWAPCPRWPASCSARWPAAWWSEDREQVRVKVVEMEIVWCIPLDPQPGPEPQSPPYVCDPAESANGGAPVHVLLARHVLGQAVEHKETQSLVHSYQTRTQRIAFICYIFCWII